MQATRVADPRLVRAPRVVEEDTCTTLYFGNLHPYVTVQALTDLCQYFGPVEHVKVIKDKATGASAGYGFVRFMDRRQADQALQALNGKLYLGQELRCNWALQSHQKEDTSHHFHIFVGDLGQEVTDAVLYAAFNSLPGCSDARVMWDHSTGRSKGYGFVSYRTKEDAERAVAKLHGQLVGSRRVRCGWAQHKQDNTQAPDYSSVDKTDPSNTNVYIGNISPDLTETDVTRHFAVYGPVAEVKLHKKGGYGFVRFERHESAVRAIVEQHGRPLYGKVLKCSWGKNVNLPSYAPPLPLVIGGVQPMVGAAGMLPGNIGVLSPGPVLLPAGPLQPPGSQHAPQHVHQQVMQGHVPMTLAAQLMLMSGQAGTPSIGNQLPLGSPSRLTSGIDPHGMFYSMYY